MGSAVNAVNFVLESKASALGVWGPLPKLMTKKSLLNLGQPKNGQEVKNKE